MKQQCKRGKKLDLLSDYFMFVAVLNEMMIY